MKININVEPNSREALTDAEFNELLLETVRYHYLKKDLAAALDSVSKLLNTPNISAETRMIALQLKGLIHQDMGQSDFAVVALKKSVEMLEVTPHTLSGFLACGHLIRILAELGRFNEATNYLELLEQTLKQIKESQAWLTRALTLVRAKYHYYSNCGDRRSARHCLNEAYEIARFLGDKSMEQKCTDELNELEENEEVVEIGTITEGEGWIFLSFNRLLLVANPRRIIDLKSAPLIQEALTQLVEGPISESELFTAISGLEFDPEKHTAHVNATLAKIRVNLPEGALNRQDGMIYLK